MFPDMPECKGPDTRCNNARNISRNGWIASCIQSKICCAQDCSSRISSYFCNIARNKFLRVSTICSISCNSATQISVFSQSNLAFKFNRWPNFRPWYVSRKKMVWTAEEESSLIDYYRGTPWTNWAGGLPWPALVLSYGMPLSPASWLSSLLPKHGDFFF